MFRSRDQCATQSMISGARSVSDLHLVLVVEDLEGLSVLEHLGPLLELELQQSVGDDSDPDVDRLDVVLNRCNRLFDILERSIV